MIDYTLAAEALRQVVDLPAIHPNAPTDYIHAAQLRLLEKCERGLTLALIRGGVGAEAASMSALAFMSQCIARHAVG